MKPAGKTTRTVLPGVESVANAQTGNDTSDRADAHVAGRRAARVDEVEDELVARADLPLYSRCPRPSWRSV